MSKWSKLYEIFKESNTRQESYTVSPLHMNLQVANFQRRKRATACQLLYCTTVLFKVL